MQPELRTLIAGDGPLRSRLEETAPAVSTLTARVRFLGHRDDVPRLMAAADLVVLPSAYEGLPNLVLEAMRFRKPVVATAAPGTTEVVVDGQTGVLVPVGNPPASGAGRSATWFATRRWLASWARPDGTRVDREFRARCDGRSVRQPVRGTGCWQRALSFSRLVHDSFGVISNHSPGSRTTGVVPVSFLTRSAQAPASWVIGGKVL